MPTEVPGPGVWVDRLRTCYMAFSYFPSIKKWLRIRWYRFAGVPTNANRVRYPYRFVSCVWDTTTDYWPGYGEPGAQTLAYANCAPPPWPKLNAAVLAIGGVSLVRRHHRVTAIGGLALSGMAVRTGRHTVLAEGGLAVAGSVVRHARHRVASVGGVGASTHTRRYYSPYQGSLLGVPHNEYAFAVSTATIGACLQCDRLNDVWYLGYVGGETWSTCGTGVCESVRPAVVMTVAFASAGHVNVTLDVGSSQYRITGVVWDGDSNRSVARVNPFTFCATMPTSLTLFPQ